MLNLNYFNYFNYFILLIENNVLITIYQLKLRLLKHFIDIYHPE